MFNKIKGTKDYNPVSFQVKKQIQEAFERISSTFDFKMIETPIMESASLFKRSVGETSDIVHKEMYEFKDKGDRDICLRPEGTAPFVRALIENKWYAENIEKFAYFGPMFRYEQPQKGRMRQFYQAGVEYIGEKNYLKDVEVIFMAQILLFNFEIKTTLKINTIGDAISRKNYAQALTEYLQKYKNELSEQSQKRLENGGVLRILDDKRDSKLEFMKNAPKIWDYLSEESKNYFSKIKKTLEEWEIEFEVDSDLVRGLDYYDEIVFEFVANDDNVGSQSTLIGGGRYSNLIKELDGPELSSVGFGFGVDRLMSIIENRIIEEENLKEQIENYTFYLAVSDTEQNLDFLARVGNLVLRGLFQNIKLEYKQIKPKKIFEKAQKYNAEILITDDPQRPDLLLVKHLETGDKMHIRKSQESLIDLIHFLVDHEIQEIDPDFAEQFIEGAFGYE
ncbi:histidine--tRNA ligase [Mycoplasmopsis glycophila]|uniref:Histidine--tRNA ligase n=1 Tax=Mycoplasmopsis glycophila TaxID=171285 RepID=A0A449AV43_9BACT|nr:histidine--tRNA ligase [Mycoplasmopsis glycophila]VEU70381.1 Histidyl-tRNA synthetase [Mycoplasmopsis glycophila]